MLSFFFCYDLILIPFFRFFSFFFVFYRSKSVCDNRKSRIQVSVWLWQWKFCRSGNVSSILSGEFLCVFFFFTLCQMCAHFVVFVWGYNSRKETKHSDERTQNSFHFMVCICIVFFTLRFGL